MKFHVLGKPPTQQPIPAGEGVSLAVLQFMELARGERERQEPTNMFHVDEVRAEEHYCFRCFGVRWFDVILPVNTHIWKKIQRCRICGKEGFG